jgi:hypothetical protein
VRFVHHDHSRRALPGIEARPSQATRPTFDRRRMAVVQPGNGFFNRRDCDALFVIGHGHAGVRHGI